MKKINKVSVFVLGLAFMFGLAGPMAVFAAGPATVNLGSAGDFVILTKSEFQPRETLNYRRYWSESIAATAMTGFGLILDSSNTFSTSAQ